MQFRRERDGDEREREFKDLEFVETADALEIPLRLQRVGPPASVLGIVPLFSNYPKTSITTASMAGY